MTNVCFLNKNLDSQYCQAAVAIVYYIICVPEHKIYKNNLKLTQPVILFICCLVVFRSAPVAASVGGETVGKHMYTLDKIL